MAEKQKIDASNPMYYLAGWRGVAAILIFIIHYRLRKYNLPSVLGYTGTHSFFLLSAYFVSIGLFRKFENKDISVWKTFKDFVLKRILKILPVYYLYIFLMLLLGVIFMYAFNLESSQVDAIRELKQFGIGLFTYTYNFREVYNVFFLHHYVPESPMTYPHLWYISFDLQMCIIIFLFIAFIRDKQTLLKISIAGVLFMIVFRFIAWEFLATIPSDEISREYIFEKIPLMQLDTVFYGFILCIYDFKKSKKLFIALILAGILCYGWAVYRAFLVSADTGLPLRTTLREDIYVIPYYGVQVIDSTVAFFIFILFACIINFPYKFKPLLNPVLMQTGALSLSMYIFQFLFILIGMFLIANVLRRFIPGVLADVIGLISFLVMDYFFAGLLYKYFDRPIQKIIDKKIFKKEPK